MAERPTPDLRARWETLQLLGPVFELIERSAPRANLDHRGYDLAQLALRLVDYVVVNQASLDGSVSPASAVDHLTQFARRMNPADQQRPWSKVARMVFSSLLNDGRPHVASWIEPAHEDGADPGSQPFRFRLLRLTDDGTGAAVSATDEAIVLYLQALSTDLADRALALKLMVEIQMLAGEFEKALASARQATRTAQGLAASLREKLDDTRRDVRAVDWRADMPQWLASVLGQIGQQLDRDRQLLVLAEQAATDSDAADLCRDIVVEVGQGQDVWIRLERFVQQAVPVFLAAQEAQRFQPRGLAAAVDLTRDLLRPAIGALDMALGRTADALLCGVAPAAAPACWGLDELCTQLLRPPMLREQPPPEVDDPGDLGEWIDDSVPEDVARVVSELLASAISEPVRLSELLAAARCRGDEVRDPKRLLDVAWGAALWAFVSAAEAAPEELPRNVDLATVLGQVVGVDDGSVLHDERFSGPDLLVASHAAFDRLDLARNGAA